jgi:hypothetical protein
LSDDAPRPAPDREPTPANARGVLAALREVAACRPLTAAEVHAWERWAAILNTGERPPAGPELTREEKAAAAIAGVLAHNGVAGLPAPPRDEARDSGTG